MNKKIFLALDNMDESQIYNLVKELNDKVMFKINDSYTKYGPQLVKNIHNLGGEIFLDLKFFDIPNTVANYMEAVADLGIYMCNIHCLGGSEMMKVAFKTLDEYCNKKNLRRPLLIGVTILTSMNDWTLYNDLKITNKNTSEMVSHLAQMAQNAGLDGVVCSPLEIEAVKNVCGKKFLTITPGIRPKWSVANDQKRFTTPYMAVKAGTDYLVIGRPIIQADKYGMTRNQAIEKINKEIEHSIWILAFDIERSGSLREHETIGIGAAVIDENFCELDRLFLPGYFPLTSSEPTVFEKCCWDEFWCKFTDQLNVLTYQGSLTKYERQHEMIANFQKFRAKWETKAKEQNVELLLVSDNSIFDGGFINEMIFEHLPKQMPIPYTASEQKYDIFLETHSQQKGLLMSIDPSFISNWDCSKRISELFEVPDPKNEHDHRPDNDAYMIALDQQILLGIRDGRIKRRKE